MGLALACAGKVFHHSVICIKQFRDLEIQELSTNNRGDIRVSELIERPRVYQGLRATSPGCRITPDNIEGYIVGHRRHVEV